MKECSSCKHKTVIGWNHELGCDRVIDYDDTHPVSGVIKPRRKQRCRVQRASFDISDIFTMIFGGDDRCGREGKFYEELQPPPHAIPKMPESISHANND